MHKPSSPLEELLMRVAPQKEAMIGISNYNLVNTGQLVSFLEVRPFASLTRVRRGPAEHAAAAACRRMASAAVCAHGRLVVPGPVPTLELAAGHLVMSSISSSTVHMRSVL